MLILYLFALFSTVKLSVEISRIHNLKPKRQNYQNNTQREKDEKKVPLSLGLRFFHYSILSIRQLYIYV
jgi:hypothetical protein